MTTHTPPDEIEERAREFFARHEYSELWGYIVFGPHHRHGPGKVAELMAAFALSEQSRDDRLAEAEAVIDHYESEGNWICAFDSCTSNPCPHGEIQYLGDNDGANGYDKAREYRRKYPRGE